MARTVENKIHLEADANPRMYHCHNKVFELLILSTIDPWKIRAIKEFIDESVNHKPQLRARL